MAEIRNDAPCTSKENKWLMPKPMQEIPYLQLCDIDFSAPKRHCAQTTSPSASSTSKIAPPMQTEMQDFFSSIAKEQDEKSIILSVIQPYNDDFAHSCDHLPPLLQNIFRSAYLEFEFTQLLTLTDSHLHYEVTLAMVDHLLDLTKAQHKSKSWFQYRAGRITASRFRQVLHTDPHKPSLSLLKSICYPKIHKFSTKATSWGCVHEKAALQAYKAHMLTSHNELIVTCTGFFISIEHPFLGASPDAIVKCNCCGLGVVEVKCPLRAQESSFEEAIVDGKFCLEKQHDGKYQLKRNHEYYYQCQLQLFVTGHSFCDFIVWTEQELHIERIIPNEALIQSALPIAQ